MQNKQIRIKFIQLSILLYDGCVGSILIGIDDALLLLLFEIIGGLEDEAVATAFVI
jgi:hypothetical protein